MAAGLPVERIVALILLGMSSVPIQKSAPVGEWSLLSEQNLSAEKLSGEIQQSASPTALTQRLEEELKAALARARSA